MTASGNEHARPSQQDPRRQPRSEPPKEAERGEHPARGLGGALGMAFGRAVRAVAGVRDRTPLPPSSPPVMGAGGPAVNAAGEEAPALIDKQVTLQVWVQVDGRQRAPEDFEAPATAAVRRALSMAAPDGLTLTVLDVRATTDAPDDENLPHA